MSALGQKQTCAVQEPMSALGQKQTPCAVKRAELIGISQRRYGNPARANTINGLLY